MNFISNRTEGDVASLLALRKKIIDRTATPEERTIWLGESVGAYNTIDLNRVEGNTEYLAALLTGYGYLLQLTHKTDWVAEDIPTDTEMERYIANIQAILNRYAPTPTELPLSMSALTYAGANAIEKVLDEVRQMIESMVSVFPRSGTMVSGYADYPITGSTGGFI